MGERTLTHKVLTGRVWGQEGADLNPLGSGQLFGKLLGRMGKMILDSQCGEPRFTSSTQVEIQVQKHMPLTSAQERHRQVDSWSFLATQLNRICEIQVQRETLSKKIRWRDSKEHSRGWFLVSTCTHPCVYVCLHRHITCT